MDACVRLASPHPLAIDLLIAEEWMELSRGIFVPNSSTIERALRIVITSPPKKPTPPVPYLGALIYEGEFRDGSVEPSTDAPRVTNMMPAIVLAAVRYHLPQLQKPVYRSIGESYARSILEILSD